MDEGTLIMLGSASLHSFWVAWASLLLGPEM